MDRASAGAQESLIGTIGRVTVSVPAGGPGEVHPLADHGVTGHGVTGNGAAPVPVAAVARAD
jgi:hypothetical protein